MGKGGDPSSPYPEVVKKKQLHDLIHLAAGVRQAEPVPKASSDRPRHDDEVLGHRFRERHAVKQLHLMRTAGCKQNTIDSFSYEAPLKIRKSYSVASPLR